MDPIERMGIEVSERYLAGAHVVLACAEDAVGLQQTVYRNRKQSNAPIVQVRTKADLVINRDEFTGDNLVFVSAETGTGLQGLLDTTNRLLAANYGDISPTFQMFYAMLVIGKH